jgi:hypothetical protein
MVMFPRPRSMCVVLKLCLAITARFVAIMSTKVCVFLGFSSQDSLTSQPYPDGLINVGCSPLNVNM